MTRILVIDDEAPLREEILDILSFEGFEAVGATNGREGLDLAKSLQPDLIICDVMMPEMDGYAVLKALQVDDGSHPIPFIFSTAKSDNRDVRFGMALGADDYLTKPFTHEELLSAIHVRLERHSRIINFTRQELHVGNEKLIRTLAHEVKNPLTAMKLSTALIESQFLHTLPAEMQDMMSVYRTGNNRIIHLLQQIVFQARLESGSIDARFVAHNQCVTSLWALLTGVVNLSRNFAYERPQGEIMFDLDDQEMQITCNLDTLRHALAEIVSNALDFSSSDQPVVISQIKQDDNLVITIRNYGTLTEAQTIKNILHNRPTKRDTAKSKGLGLGLTLAQHIITLHNGSLQLDETFTDGTTLVVHLPLNA